MLLPQQVYCPRTEDHAGHSVSKRPTRIGIGLNEVQSATALFQHTRGQIETDVAHRRLEPLTYLPGAGTDLDDQIACFGLTDLNHLLRYLATASLWQTSPPLKQTGLA